MKGMVRTVLGGVYSVALDDGDTVDASLRGRLKREARTGDQVVIGDLVEVERIEDHWVIESVHPRRTEIVRSRFGGRTVKALVANADRLLVVVAVKKPKPNRETIDRLLVVAENAGVEAVLVVNKTDLDRDGSLTAELVDAYEPLGYTVLPVSAVDRSGLEAFGDVVCVGISALAGPSGVGKSSLVNAIEPELDLRIGDVSVKRGTGRHTTVSSRLIPLSCGGLLADTPGFSDVGVWGVPPGDLDDCFPEFRPHAGGCRFRGCTHLHEPDCAVQAAVEAGGISSDRYRSYELLWREAEEASERARLSARERSDA